MLKRRIVALTALAVAAALTVGLAGASAKQKETVTLSLETLSVYQKGTDLLIANFERVYPDIVVKPIYQGSSSAQIQAVATQIQAGNAPDIFWANSGNIIGADVLGAAGKVVDLGNRPWVKRVKSISKDVTDGKKVYGFAAGLTPAGIFYNGATFKQLGLTVPKTFGQLLTMCTKIKAAGKIPFAMAMGSGTSSLQASFYAMVVLLPAYSRDPKWTAERSANSVTFAGSPIWQKAVQRVVDMNAAGCFPPHPEGLSVGDAVAMEASGQAVMMFSNGALNAGLQAGNPSLKTDTAFPMPGDVAKQTRVFTYISPVLAISKTTQHLAEALKFIDFLGRAKQNTLFNTVSAGLSGYDVSKGLLPTWGKSFGPFFKADMTLNNPATKWPNPALGTNVLATDLVGLFTGQKTVTTILQDLDTHWLS